MSYSNTCISVVDNSIKNLNYLKNGPKFCLVTVLLQCFAITSTDIILLFSGITIWNYQNLRPT